MGGPNIAVGAAFRDHVLARLVPMGPVSARAKLGGAGLYLDGTIFALIKRNDVLYFRTDDSNRTDYKAAGTEPFVTFPDKAVVMPYRNVPPKILEDGDSPCA